MSIVSFAVIIMCSITAMTFVFVLAILEIFILLSVLINSLFAMYIIRPILSFVC